MRFWRAICAAGATGAVTAAVGLLSAGTAAAAISPSLTLNQGAGTSAAGTHNLGMTINFNPSSADDTPKTLQIALPPGLIANANIDGGNCLKTAAITAACVVGTGTATASAIVVPGTPITPPITAPATIQLTYYLVAPPKPGDLAGLAVSGQIEILGFLPLTTISLGTGDVSLRPSGSANGVGLTIALGLPQQAAGFNASVSSIASTFNGLRYPSSCPSPSARVAIAATSYLDAATRTASAPLSVTGCGAAAYAPHLSVTAVKDSGDRQVTLTANVTQAASELTTGSTQLNFPPNVLAPNINVAGALCVSRAWGSCTPVGSATVTSPVYPTPLSGKAYLTGDSKGLEIALVFPQPFSLTLVGRVNLAAGSTTFAGEPDIPQTSLRVVLNGGPHGAFATTCQAKSGSASATFVSQGGDKTVHRSDAFTVSGWKPCTGAPPGNGGPGSSSGSGGNGSGGQGGSGGHGGGSHARTHRPTLSAGAISGLLTGKPTMRFTASKGKSAGNLSRLTIGLPRGLTFRGRRHHHSTVVTGVAVRGAKTASARLSHGHLVIVLRKPGGGRVTVKLGPAALRETSHLRAQATHHRLKSLGVRIGVLDTAGRSTHLRLAIHKLGLPAHR